MGNGLSGLFVHTSGGRGKNSGGGKSPRKEKYEPNDKGFYGTKGKRVTFHDDGRQKTGHYIMFC